MPGRLDIDLSPLQSRPQAGLVVALSGGLDSSALLYALASQPELRGHGLRAVHVHHGLHADADAWQAHCERLCASLGIALTCIRVRVDASGDGPEAAARRARHAAFERMLGDGEVLALAHHRDDQAETFLLRALRASGPDGLRAMRAWRPCGRGWLWRPLLGTARADLRAYAEANAIEWMEDPSNADARFDRNFLRAQVMPRLRERWPHADGALARSAELCAEASELLDQVDAAALREALTPAHDLRTTVLRELAPTRRARVLRAWVASRGLPPLPGEGVRRVEADLLDARADARARFDWHGASVRAWQGLLHAGPVSNPLDAGFDVAWDGQAPLPLPDGGALALVSPVPLPAALRVRARRGGERIRLPGRGHSHALKHVLQALHVPPWTREHLPLLVDGTDVLAAGDVVIAARLQARLDAAGSRLAWTRPPGA